MEQLGGYRGVEIWRTSAGDLVLMDPRDGREDRLKLVQALAISGILDALFPTDLQDARETIDRYLDALVLGEPH